MLPEQVADAVTLLDLRNNSPFWNDFLLYWNRVRPNRLEVGRPGAGGGPIEFELTLQTAFVLLST